MHVTSDECSSKAERQPVLSAEGVLEMTDAGRLLGRTPPLSRLRAGCSRWALGVGWQLPTQNDCVHVSNTYCAWNKTREQDSISRHASSL